MYNPINDAGNTLAQNHVSGDGTLVLVDALSFGTPPPVPFRVTVRDWTNTTIYSITSTNGNTFTIGSVLEGTIDHNYSAGATVDNFITAGDIKDLQDQVFPSLSYTEALCPELRVCCWGDSTTLGGSAISDGGKPYPAQLQSSYPDYMIINEGVGGFTSAQILSRFQSLPERHSNTTVIMAGRNDLFNVAIGYYTLDSVLANIASMVSALGHNRYRVMSPWNTDGEGVGTPVYNTLISLKTALQSAYGSQYIDAHHALVAQYDPNNSSDVSCYNNDIVPISLRQGLYDVHLNNNGYALVAGLLHSFLDPLSVVERPVSQSKLLAALVDVCARPQIIGSSDTADAHFNNITAGLDNNQGEATVHTQNRYGGQALIVQAVSNQTGNLLTCRDSLKKPFLSVGPTGNLLQGCPSVHFSQAAANLNFLRVYDKLCYYCGNNFGMAGAFVILTPFTKAAPTMINMKVRGFIYDATSPFELVISGYIYSDGVLYGPGYINFGKKRCSVRLGVLTSTQQVVIVLGETTDSWDIPNLWVDSVMQSFGSVDETNADISKWSISLVTDLTPYSGLMSVPDAGYHDLPTGGSSGQVLTKNSATNYDVGWISVGGTGTVTSVAVATANGVSGTVATNTTTPVITLALGDITPTSVVSSGKITASGPQATGTVDTTPLLNLIRPIQSNVHVQSVSFGVGRWQSPSGDTNAYTRLDIGLSNTTEGTTNSPLPNIVTLQSDGTIIAHGSLRLSKFVDGSSAVSRDYVTSRGQNLVTNGSGMVASNYNFSTLSFDSVETHGGYGSFSTTVVYGTFYNDEFISVDVTRYFRMILWGKSGNADGSLYNAANSQYAGIACFDIDGLRIDPTYYAKAAGSTDTTLATALNPGDTVVNLTNATGWGNDAYVWTRQFIWWPYINSKGYTYPNYTYSRNWTGNLSTDFYNNGAWNAGGISGNTITLRSAWSGPALPAGTAVRNATSGGTYKYIAVSGSAVPNVWTRYEGWVGGIDTQGVQNQNQFPYGTAFIKILFLTNFHGLSDNIIRWSDIWFSELDARNLALTASNIPDLGATYAKTITLNTASLLFNSPISFTNDGSGNYSGTLALRTQAANTVLAGPTTGTAATPTIRILVAGDIPDLSATYLVRSNNLSDLTNVPAARSSLGLGTVATHAATDFATVITLNTDGVLYTTPVTFTNSGGTFTGTSGFRTQSANTVLAGPTSGAAANPTMRALVPVDLPTTGLNITSHYGTITTDTDAATITFDMSASDWHQVTLGGNRTLAVSNVTVGQQFAIVLQQDATGSRTVTTWFSGILWSGGTVPTLTTTANKRDVLTFKCISTGTYLGFVSGLNF